MIKLMNSQKNYSLGIDIGSTTVKIALLDSDKNIVFSDYKRHFANIQETLSELLEEVEKVEGIKRIRFMSPNPEDFADEVIEVMAKSKKIENQNDIFCYN